MHPRQDLSTDGSKHQTAKGQCVSGHSCAGWSLFKTQSPSILQVPGTGRQRQPCKVYYGEAIHRFQFEVDKEEPFHRMMQDLREVLGCTPSVVEYIDDVGNAVQMVVDDELSAALHSTNGSVLKLRVK